MHKLAMIGFGGMGTWHVENIMEKLPEITVKGVYDVREEANENARKLDLYIYSSVEEIIADPEIDIVTVATPNNFHKDLSITCLRGGKNVICEKPVTMNAAELEEIIAVAEETGKLFSVHQNRRWDKDYNIVKKILADKILDEPYFIESRVEGSIGYLHGWRGSKINGGGMLLDWGVHLLDQALDMIDSKVVSVYANFANVFTKEVDDNLKIMLTFENNLSYLIEVATNCFVVQPRWFVNCVNGTAVVEDWACNGKMVQKKTDGDIEFGDVIVYTEAGPTRTMAPRPVHTTLQMELPEVKTDWTEYYKNILDVLDNSAELIVKPEQALRVMRVIDLLFESAEKKTGISCNL